MPNIKTETIEFAKNLVKAVDTQDNRATAHPYLFLIQRKRRRCVPEGYGDFAAWIYDGNIFDDEDLVGIFGREGETLHDIVERLGCERVHYNEEWSFENDCNAFFTFDAYKKHVKINGHNLGECRSYVIHCFRNEEMQRVLDLIREVAAMEL